MHKKLNAKRIIIGLLLSIVAAVSINVAAYVAFEKWVDPFPNSSLLERVFNTKYIAHVQAEIVVGDEHITVDRNIRCLDLKGKPALPFRPHAKFPNNGQVGDNLVFTNREGRLFIISVPGVCAALVMRYIANKGYDKLDPDSDQITPLRLSRDEINTPMLFEIHGGYQATQIDAYVSSRLLRAGYHGIRLLELTIEKAPSATTLSFVKDWNGYEWFGEPNWIRPWSFGKTRAYSAGYIVPIKPDVWSVLGHLGYSGKYSISVSQEYKMEMLSRVERIQKSQRDLFMYDSQSELPLFSSFIVSGFINLHASLQRDMLKRRLPDIHPEFSWAMDDLIPCPIDEELSQMVCRPEFYGIVQYKRMNFRHRTSKDDPYITYKLRDVLISPPKIALAGYYEHKSKMVYIANETQTYLTR